MKYTDTHFTILNMSAGGDYDTHGQSRVDEVMSFWQSFENASVHASRRRFISGFTEDSLVHWVETNTPFDYDAILVPPSNDFHFEHRIINSVGRALSRKTKVSVIEYNTPSVSHEWVANVFVDVTEQYERKKQLLQLFKSQQTRMYFEDRNIDSFHTNYFCNKRQYGYYEQLKLDFLFA